MFKPAYLTAIVFLLTLGSYTSPANADEFFVSQSSFVDSRALPLYFIKTRWDTPYKDGDYTMMFNTSEVGVRKNNYSLTLQHRFDLVTQYSPDMIAALYATRTLPELVPGQTYDLQMSIQQLRAWAIKGGYEWFPAEGIKLEVNGSALYGYYMTSGDLRGKGVSTGKMDYDFDFAVDYFYSEDLLFNRRVAEPQGFGFALGMGALWQPTHQYSLRLGITDWPARVYWHDAPHTKATANSRTKEYDANGYVKYSPAISGVESTENFTQTLSPRIALDNRLTFKTYEIYSESRYMAIQWYHTVGGALNFGDRVRYALGVQMPNNVMVVEVSRSWMNVRFFSDTWRFREIRHLGLEGSIQVPF